MIVTTKDKKPLTLAQRGRAGMQFLGALQTYSAGPMRARARAEASADPDMQALADAPQPSDAAQWQARNAEAKAIAERYPAFRFERLYQRYVAEENFIRGIAAIEAIRPDAEAYLSRRDDGPVPDRSNLAVVELDASVTEPAYHAGVEWHLQPGGWDGYDLSGPMFSAGIWPHVFKLGGWAAVDLGDDVTTHRAALARQLPKESYRRIFDPCCGGVTTMAAIHSVFPEAELVGCDIEGHLLKVGAFAAEKQGLSCRLIQKDARDTGEPDGHYDGIVMQTALHEMPVEAGKAVLREMARILAPGGDIAINDIAPFNALDPFGAVLMDWETENRGEPYFREFCAWDRAAFLREELGFVNVEAYPLRASGYPYIVRGTKPAA